MSLHRMFHKPTFIFCLRLHNYKKPSCRRTTISTSFATPMPPLKEKFLGFIFLPTQDFTLVQFPLINNSGQEDEATIRDCNLVAICLHVSLLFACFSSVCMFLFCLHVSLLFACWHVCGICLHESLCSHLRTYQMRKLVSDVNSAASWIRSKIYAGIRAMKTRRQHDDDGKKGGK